ncbi:MAG: division/cell wall cluster transcriptional repressor MraZ [bacterium]|nr:division/cell wall cluster transcriptional repressor MraZ [bacterium]
MTDRQAQSGTKKSAQQGAVQAADGVGPAGVWSTTHTLFLGEYKHKMDAKGRLALPAKFRAKLQKEGAVVTKGNENCLYLFTTEAWKPLAEKLASLPSISSKIARAAQRTLLAGATVVTPDRQGRILLPPHLREYAGLTTEKGEAADAGPADVVVAGLYNRVEIWPAARWQAERAESNLDELGPELAKFGI